MRNFSVCIQSYPCTMVDGDHHEIMDPHAEPLHKKQLQKEQEDSSMDFLCPARRTHTMNIHAIILLTEMLSSNIIRHDHSKSGARRECALSVLACCYGICLA